MKIIKTAFFLLAVLYGLFIIGPEVASPDIDRPLPPIDQELNSLKKWISDKEAALTNIKPKNASQLEFYDSIAKKTAYSVLYLHGFSASIGEGDPVHRNIAKALKANLYLPRLSDHGLIVEEPLLQFTGQKYIDSAKEALAIAKKIGEKVILISSSTGGTLSLILGNDPDIAALLLFGPNVEIYNPDAKLLTLPWGLYLARAVVKSKYHIMDNITPKKRNYWTTRYRLESTIHLQKMLEVSMQTEIFNRVTAPVFMGYYYKSEEEKDEVVSIPAMLKMFDGLGTPAGKKQKMTFPDAGDHVIISNLTNDQHHKAEKASLDFLKNQLGVVIN